MSEQQDSAATIAGLRQKIVAQQKTIEILMDSAERRSSNEISGSELLTRNINLERVVEQKTERLKSQGEELRRTLEELKSAQTRLLQAQKLESVGQLAAGIAHEINSPAQFISSNIDFLDEAFTGLQGFVDALQVAVAAVREKGSPCGLEQPGDVTDNIDWSYLRTEIPTAIQQSKEGIKRITTIVQAMKEFSHPGTREKAHHDLNRIIATTITVASNEWKYCAEIATDLDESLPKVYCLAEEMGQVILNMLINASHAIVDRFGERPGKGRITVATRRLPGAVEISIADTGCGIDENIRDRIFDPFFTTKEVGRGTGQGLAISHDVVEKKHGGTLTFTSELGVGTTFFIRLPLEPDEARKILDR